MTKTERIYLNSTVQRNEDLQLWVEDFAAETGMTKRDALRVSLLVEETAGMVRGMMQDYESEMWLEGDRNSCTLYLDVVSRSSEEEKQDQQTAPAGFMGKICELLQCAYRFDSDADVPDAWLDAVPGYMSFGAAKKEEKPVMMGQWSLGNYRHALKEKVREDATAETSLDELEKSIVANLADEVIIGIKDSRVKLVISKQF